MTKKEKKEKDVFPFSCSIISLIASSRKKETFCGIIVCLMETASTKVLERMDYRLQRLCQIVYKVGRLGNRIAFK